MATVGLDLELVGSAEGVPVEIVGRGQYDHGAGRLALEVRVPRPLLLFDPALMGLGLLDVLALAAVRSGAMRDGDAGEADPNAHVHVRVRTGIYDEHGREAGGWRVVAALGRTGGGVRLDGQLLDHVARIEHGERVVAVDAPLCALAQPVGDGGEAGDGALLAGAWDVRTGRGNGYRGVTTTVVGGWPWPAAWAGAEVLRIGIDDVQVRRTEHDSAAEASAIEAEVATDRLGRSPG